MTATAACPLCAGPGERAFEKDGFPHYACTRCGTWFVHPVPPPDALAAFYSAIAAQNSRICWEGDARHAHGSWRRALRDAERVAGRGPLLDVGCGAGQFLAFARALGWSEVEGTELSAPAAALAAERTGARVHTCELEHAPLAPGRFAVVTLWDVLEHLPDPLRALRCAHALLRPGGVLALGTPHRHGVTLRTFGARALLVMPPEHLFLASRAGLRAAAAEAGFDVLRLDTIDVHLRQWVGFLRGQTSSAEATPSAAPDGDERRAFLSTYRRVTGSALFGGAQTAANAVLRTARLGDQLLGVLRRRG